MSFDDVCLNCGCVVEDDAALCEECYQHAHLADCDDCGEALANCEHFDWIAVETYVCENCMGGD